MCCYQNPAARNEHTSANDCWPSSSSNMGVGTIFHNPRLAFEVAMGYSAEVIACLAISTTEQPYTPGSRQHDPAGSMLPIQL